MNQPSSLPPSGLSALLVEASPEVVAVTILAVSSFVLLALLGVLLLASRSTIREQQRRGDPRGPSCLAGVGK